jgi:MOSC domain-containing protein YiiM
MGKKLRQLGTVKLVQVQPAGLIIETPEDYYYDPSRRVEVERLQITPRGTEAVTPQGERVLDIHHKDHPESRHLGGDDISINFTSHYAAMRAQFGEHMVDGIAGENIIIDYEQEVWLPDLNQQIIIENPDTRDRVLLEVEEFAAPCEEFSHFAARSQHERLPAEKLKATLQFLNNGRRGFLLVLSKGQTEAAVQPGDQVYVVAAI